MLQRGILCGQRMAACKVRDLTAGRLRPDPGRRVQRARPDRVVRDGLGDRGFDLGAGQQIDELTRAVALDIECHGGDALGRQ